PLSILFTYTTLFRSFGKYRAGKVEPVIERFGRIHGILSRHRIHHKEDFMRLGGLFYGRYFVHQRFIDRQAAGGIHDDHIVSLLRSEEHTSELQSREN